MHAMAKWAPCVLGIGGGTKPGSSTEQALQLALDGAKAMGARVELFGAEDIMRLPLYLAEGWKVAPAAVRLVEAVRAADGLILASPAYHGSISGAVKNAIDYIEETSRDARPYLTGIPVGVIGIAAGHQAAMGTLVTLRSIVHSLRGWPTPLGVALNSRATPLVDGSCKDAEVLKQLTLVGRHVAEFCFGGTTNEGQQPQTDKWYG
jgi:FMN reductase